MAQLIDTANALRKGQLAHPEQAGLARSWLRNASLIGDIPRVTITTKYPGQLPHVGPQLTDQVRSQILRCFDPGLVQLLGTREVVVARRQPAECKRRFENAGRNL